MSRLWAEKKIAELNLNEDKNKDEITLTGKKFGIVTKNTSLIVLESLNDYLQNNIIPPTEMQNEYFQQINKKEKEATEKQQSHIDVVVKLSEVQSKWWNTNYPILQGTPPPIKNSVRFTPPVITDSISVDEEVSSADIQESTVVVSIRDVQGTDEENGENISYNQDEISVGYGNQSGIHLRGSSSMASKSMDATINKASIQLNAWDPQTPYLKVLQYASPGQEYNTYVKLKAEYGSIPAFYIDASDFFSKLGKKDTAVVILSNLAELSIESPQLLRILGNKLLDLNCSAEAVIIFKKVLKLKGEEPQSYRDLGLAYQKNGEFQKAIATLYEVVKKEWDSRFPGIELIVMNEINDIIAAHPELDYKFIDKRLIKKEPVDIRVVLSWDTDNCDMDLWVTDPSKEKCFYSHKLTRLGGKISNDFTGGYGPEEFMIKKAVNGEYLVQTNYYGTRSQAILAPVNLHLIFFTNYGKPNQKEQQITIRLENQKDIIDVGKFSFITN